METQDIITRITAQYPGAVVDIDGADCSFAVYVISECFAGMSTLKRQQALLALFQTELKSGALHALSIKARTPQEQAASGAGLVQIGG